MAYLLPGSKNMYHNLGVGAVIRFECSEKCYLYVHYLLPQVYLWLLTLT
jgi:hypothetical protein